MLVFTECIKHSISKEMISTEHEHMYISTLSIIDLPSPPGYGKCAYCGHSYVSGL